MTVFSAYINTANKIYFTQDEKSVNADGTVTLNSVTGLVMTPLTRVYIVLELEDPDTSVEIVSRAAKGCYKPGILILHLEK